MSAWIPDRPQHDAPDSDTLEFVEPGSRARTLARWELRALQWRAARLAEVVFGGPVGARLIGHAGRGLRGMLELEVPFTDLGRHREAEKRFLAGAAADDVLGGVPLVVVFTPRPARS